MNKNFKEFFINMQESIKVFIKNLKIKIEKN